MSHHESHSSGNGSITRDKFRDHRSKKDDRSTRLHHRNLMALYTPRRTVHGRCLGMVNQKRKNSLNTVLLTKNPTEEVLNTLLAEVEYTVNNRPLTYVTTDPEAPEALTPNHFLLGGSVATPTPGAFNESDLNSRAQWRVSQQLADMFWSRWLREYLPELQHRREPHGHGGALKIGDVVLIADNTLPRNTWPRGVITAIYPGTDGVTRVADVQTKNGILRRPTKKIVIIPTEPAVLP
ncbi:hypothetical protein EVAR_98436_1 [Eumeta japonica]|uniref:DUF5641 domain-containing protein n=1 Tax=Eumeta variegata TaxID=151549 RepID=A0A4C2A1G1_EUMVA|nr:hypothetical protein EVAR_98436_1 [Eumeta japonica]